MKTFLLLAVLCVAVAAFAQTFAAPSIGSSGPIATSPAQCPTAAAHAFSICPVETGAATGALYISINGAAPALLSGSPGPAGAAGPAGPTGPAGPAGPVQSFSTLKCPTSNVSNTGLSASSCLEQ
jgi:hypothetical protein